MRFGLVIIFTCAALPALAGSVKDCASIQNAFAYNNCLASYGPPRAGAARVVPDGGGSEAASGAAATGGVVTSGRSSRAAPRASAAYSQRVGTRSTHGRVSASFTIGQPVKASRHYGWHRRRYR